MTNEGGEIPVIFRESLTKEALLVRFVFRSEPDSACIEVFQDIAQSWALVGLYGGFGGRLKEFEGDPEFDVELSATGEVVYATILDLGSAPFDLAIDVLLRALRHFAASSSLPLDRVEVGEELVRFSDGTRPMFPFHLHPPAAEPG